METKIKSLWARIILSSYRNLPRVISSLERTIDCVVMQGVGKRGHYIPAEQLIEKIIETIYRKQGLANLKVIADDVIRCMNADYVKLLYLKFIKTKKFQDIADSMGVSLRTIFRHYDKALYQFSSILILKGFDDERLEEEYRGDMYIEKIKKKIIDEYRFIDDNRNKINHSDLKGVLDKINIVYHSDIMANSY